MADYSKKEMTILKDGKLLTPHAKIAFSMIDRTIGLLGTASLAEDKALILSPCHSIHTFFMRFAIDVAFVNTQGQILALYSNLKPFRITRFYGRAKKAIEWPAGVIDKWNLKIGEKLFFEENHV